MKKILLCCMCLLILTGCENKLNGEYAGEYKVFGIKVEYNFEFLNDNKCKYIVGSENGNCTYILENNKLEIKTKNETYDATIKNNKEIELEIKIKVVDSGVETTEINKTILYKK